MNEEQLPGQRRIVGSNGQRLLSLRLAVSSDSRERHGRCESPVPKCPIRPKAVIRCDQTEWQQVPSRTLTPTLQLDQRRANFGELIRTVECPLRRRSPAGSAPVIRRLNLGRSTSYISSPSRRDKVHFVPPYLATEVVVGSGHFPHAMRGAFQPRLE